MTEPTATEKKNNLAEHRYELLLRMYDQMFSDINRHIQIVWQSVGVLASTFGILVGILALFEKQVPIGLANAFLDVATALIMLIVGWLLAHVYDASYWYNRNLVIIANIERQFLSKEDLRNIHYYFGEHPPNEMITQFMIQYVFGLVIGGIMLLYHIFYRLIPAFGTSFTSSALLVALPYVVAIIVAICLRRLHRKKNRSYKKFITNSPGITIDTEGIQ